MNRTNLKRKITEEKMWCCVCGLIDPPDNLNENNNNNSNNKSSNNNNNNNTNSSNENDIRDDQSTYSDGQSSDDLSSSSSDQEEDEEEVEVGVEVDVDEVKEQKKEEPKQFVVTGSCKAELKISHIPTDLSSDCKTACPYECSHSVPSLGIHYMSISSDSKTIAAVSVDGTLHIVDVKKGIQLANIGHNIVKNFFSAEFSRLSSASVFAGCGNGHVYKYDTTTGELQQSLDTNRLQCIIGLCVSPKSDYVACSDFDGFFTLFDAKTGKIIKQTNYKKPIRRMVFDPKYRNIFAACDDKSVKIIELPSGELCSKLLGHNTWVMSIDFSANAHRFVTGGFDGAVKIWDHRLTKCPLTFLRNDNYNLWDVAYDKLNQLVVSVADGKGLSIHYC